MIKRLPEDTVKHLKECLGEARRKIDIANAEYSGAVTFAFRLAGIDNGKLLDDMSVEVPDDHAKQSSDSHEERK